jgi:hypothetical protein
MGLDLGVQVIKSERADIDFHIGHVHTAPRIG